MSGNLTEAEHKVLSSVSNENRMVSQDVGDLVVVGELLVDSEFVYSRFIRKGGDLIYHVFRGPGVPDRFWGQGEFGLYLLGVVEQSWPLVKSRLEHIAESVRPEARQDDPQKPSKYPPRFYGSYFVCIPSVYDKPLAPKVDRIRFMVDALEERLKKEMPAWVQKNGNGSS